MTCSTQELVWHLSWHIKRGDVLCDYSVQVVEIDFGDVSKYFVSKNGDKLDVKQLDCLQKSQR